jgi:hypothetical protein
LDLLYQSVYLNAIHVWDGPYLFFRREGLKVTGNYINLRVTDENDFQFPDEPVNRAIGISLLVGFFPR